MKHVIRYSSNRMNMKSRKKTLCKLQRKRKKKISKFKSFTSSNEQGSTASSIGESSFMLERTEESPPPYYLPMLKNNLFGKNSGKRVQRYFNHFNLTRKCFDKMNHIERRKDKSMIYQPRMLKKTLVLDLDETLVHVFSNPQSFETTEVKCQYSQTEFRTFFVKKRPYCDSFLKKMASLFRVIIFTASKKVYADPVIDLLDPEGHLISARFYRDSCSKRNGQLVKDLDMFGVDPRDIMIVDNLALSFGLQPENGIPVVCYWGDDEEERELVDLAGYLEFLHTQDDVRVSIQKHFHWEELQLYYRDTKMLLQHYLCLK